MTADEHKQILRSVIKEVIVDQKRSPGRVWLKIVWQTGAVSEHWYTRRICSYSKHAHLKQIQRHIRELHAEGKLDDEIAAGLSAEGLRTTEKRPFNGDAVWFLRRRMGLLPAKPIGTLPNRWEGGAYSVREASESIGVCPGTIY